MQSTHKRSVLRPQRPGASRTPLAQRHGMLGITGMQVCIENERLLRDNTSLQDRSDQLTRQLESTVLLNKDLKKKVNAMFATGAEYKKATQRINELNASLEAVTKTLAETRRDGSSLEAAHKELLGRYKEQSYALQDHATQHRLVATAHTGCINDISSLKRSVQLLTEQERSAATALAALTQEHKETTLALAHAKKELAHQQKVTASLQVQVDDGSRLHSKQEHELETAMSTLSQLRLSERSWCTQFGAEREKNAALEGEMAALAAEHTRAKATAARESSLSASRLEEVEKAHHMVSDLSAKLVTAMSDLNVLKKDHTEVTAAHDTVKTKYTALVLSNMELTESHNNLKIEHADCEDTIARLEAYAAMHLDCDGEKDTLRGEMSAMQTSLEELQAEHAKTVKALGNSRKSLAKLKEAHEPCGRKILRLEVELSESAANAESHGKSSRAGQEERKTLLDKLFKAGQEITQLTSDVKTSQLRHEKDLTSISTLKESLAALEKQLVSEKKARQMSQDVVKNLVANIKSLKTSLEEAHAAAGPK